VCSVSRRSKSSSLLVTVAACGLATKTWSNSSSQLASGSVSLLSSTEHAAALLRLPCCRHGQSLCCVG
jgi:hypothetical protein